MTSTAGKTDRKSCWLQVTSVLMECWLTPPLQFRSGDVLGVYQPQQNASAVRLYYSVNDSAPDIIQIDATNPTSFNSSESIRTVSGQYILVAPVTGTATTYIAIDLFYTH